MKNESISLSDLLPVQEARRAKCFHPSGTFVEFSKEEVEQSIPQRFQKIVGLYSSRVAVKMGDRSLTFEGLNQAANQIARGCGSEPIALLFEHGLDAIAAILGVLKAGKFYVALAPSFPPDRKAYMLEDSGAVEHKLVQIWREVLELNPIGINDHFFDLGGDSLAATRIVSRVTKKLRFEIPLQSLFRSPTVADMAAVIIEHQANNFERGRTGSYMAELESLSDDEAQRLLYSERGTERR
jgi:acyl carrier protein